MKNVTKSFFCFVLFSSLLLPLRAEAASVNRVPGDRAHFQNVLDSTNLLKEYGADSAKPAHPNPANVSYHGSTSSGGVYFSLRGLKGWDLQDSNVGAFPKCSNSADLECQKIMRTRGYMATLPPCLSASQSDCISRLAVTTTDGRVEDALPVKLLGRAIQDLRPNQVKSFDADASVNLPAGGEKWLWSFPKYRNSSGSLFIPSVSLWQQVDINSISDPYQYPNPNLWISLSPVAAEPSNSNSPFRIHSAADFDLRRESFVAPDLFTLDFRSSVPWTTWNKASLADLAIESSRSGKDYVYSISGRPSLIPEVGKSIQVTKENLEAVKKEAGGNFSCPSNETDLSQCRGSIYVGGKGGISEEAFDKLESVEKLIDKTSDSLTYFWLLQTSIETPLVSQVRECTTRVARTQPAGTVSSNATLQQDGPPSWDPSAQTFVYRVGALSKLPTGEDFKGTYTFQLSLEMAECIWGKRPTAQSFTVQIINSDKTVQLVTSSTTTLRETFIFNASGFHFSSPRIVVQSKEGSQIIEKAKEPIISPPAKTEITSKKFSLTCVKGKLKRTITSTSKSKLSCPSGWKKA